VARTWVELMRRLGYDRYGTEGGDLGAYVAPEVARAAPEHVVGVYVISGLGFPAEADVPETNDEERAAYARTMEQDWVNGVDHHALLRAAPQTFAYGWHDSPHFIAMDRPDDLAADIGRFFAKLDYPRCRRSVRPAPAARRPR
jgi:pimeloyl-ACP methyl ester carboxylesterase